MREREREMDLFHKNPIVMKYILWDSSDSISTIYLCKLFLDFVLILPLGADKHFGKVF